MGRFANWRQKSRERKLNNQVKNLINTINYAKKTNQATDSTFSWTLGQSSQSDKTVTSFSRPAHIDKTESMVINHVLTEGFYYNTYPGLKLAGCFAKTPINKPIQFMGFPVPVVDNEKQQLFLKSWISANTELIKDIHRFSFINGTRWVWPWFDSNSNSIIVEFIPDYIIGPIIKDIDTGEVIEIHTDEEIEASIGDDTTTTIRRKRIFTKESIKITYPMKGAYAGKLIDIEYRNPIGILPIPFANNKKEGEVRGKSVYGTILPDCKTYHDVHLQYSRILAKFNIKLVQHTSDVNSWKTNNGINSLTTLDIYERDLFMNQGEEEKTEYIFPQGGFDVYEKALNLLFWKIVQGSQVPEIFWGLNAQGNHASVEDSRGEMVKYVKDAREQYTNSWIKFFSALLTIYNITTMQNAMSQISVEWNQLDALDEKTRAVIFKDFASGVKNLIDSAGMTKEQLFNLWVEMYPQATEAEFEKFVIGISEMARHKSFRETDYEMIRDLTGENDAN